MPANESQQSNPFGLLVLIGVGWLLVSRGCGQSKDAPEPAPVVDVVAEAMDTYEVEWRKAQSDLAIELTSGRIASEGDATKWFQKANGEAMRTAFKPLADAEFEAFGGDKWTPEKHAEYIRRYVR